MKVMLILPTFGYDHGYPVFFSNSDFPTGFAYIASAIRDSGHEVMGLNPNNDVNYKSAYDMAYSKIIGSLSKRRPGLIGLGGLSTDFNFINDAIKIIREYDPSIPIVLGGGIVNSDAEFIFSTLKPDYCIKGEAEEAIVELINALESGNPALSEVANIGYWNKNTPIFTKQNLNYVGLDERSFPDYEPFDLSTMIDEYSMAARYVYRYIRPNPRPMSIVSARGCPFSCTFCIHGDASDVRKYRYRSIANIIEEIKYLYEMYQFNILIILDELFVAKKDRLQEFSSALINAKLENKWDFNWIFQTHANSKLDYNTLALAKKAGCYCFTYGLESASPNVLSSMNKKSKLPEIVKAINISEKVGLGFYAAFIFGDVVENERTIHESMEFFYRHCLDLHVNFAAISPYPGSALFDHCLQTNIITDKMKYYKSIDKDICNMTSMRDSLWFPWVYLTIYLSRFFNYTKSTDASYCEVDTASSSNQIARYYNQSICNIEAKCPHCSMQNHYKEMLQIREVAADDDIKSTLSFKSIVARIVGLSENKYNLSKMLRNGAVYFLVSFWDPLYKELKPLIGKSEHASSFVTGCQHCNKRIAVNVDSHNNAQSFNTIRMILKRLLRI